MLLPDFYKMFRQVCFFEFAIKQIEYDFSAHNIALSITVAHYELDTPIKVEFKEVLYQAVMPEHFIFMLDEDAWQQEAFLAKAKSSQLIAHLDEYTLLKAQSEVHGLSLEALHHYRIIGQNFFVEIVSEDTPSIY